MQMEQDINQIKHFFKKEEKLCRKKIINQLFSEGKTFLVYPVKVSFLETSLPVSYPAQVAFSVSKKKFRKAVHRNQIKRLMREAYRLNKYNFYKLAEKKQYAVFFIFIGDEIPEFRKIQQAIKKAIVKLTGSSSV